MEFSNTGGMRSPFSPRVRQSITGRKPIGMSARKNQNKYIQSPGTQNGDVIYKTPISTVETYGSPLPVMVTETLTFASGEVSVRLSPCGWCWLVAGRRVVAWPRDCAAPTAPSSPAPAPPAARELTLPQTDLAHKADLVELFYEDGAQMPSCVGVSPEGVVRYWWSVGHPSAMLDVSCELGGQECERLLHARDYLLLATTTCSVVLLRPHRHEGRATVTCRVLRPPSGWLGGIGRRVSHLFFGSMPAHGDTKLVGLVVVSEGQLESCEVEGREGCVLLVGGAGGGGGPLLQLWRGAELHEHSLRRALTDAHARAHHAPHGDPNSVEITALDVRASGNNGVLMLISAVNVARSPDVRYAIAHISVEDPANPRVTSLIPLRSWPQEVDQPATRFLPIGPQALLYTPTYLALVSSTVSNDKVDFIDVSSEGDRILGAELCNGVPLVFSKKHGVLALTTADNLAPTPSLCDSPMGSPCPSDMYDGNLSLYEIDPHEVSMVTTDACGKLKTAFLFHLRRDAVACKAIIDALFPQHPASSQPPLSPNRRPAPEEEQTDVDAVLDTTVLNIATEMLDDIPAGDPRLTRAGGLRTRVSLGSSAALQHQHQLRDKQRAFTLFRDFLRAQGLMRRLQLVSAESGGGVTRTVWALCSLAEQLAIAVALRRLQHGPDAQLIESAIYQVVCGDSGEVEEEPEVEAALSSGALSPADVCYRRVSRVGRVLRALAANAHAHAGADARANAAHVHATINIINVSAIIQVSASLFHINLHCRQSAHNCPDANVRWQVCEASAALADRLLADAEPLQNEPRTRHMYEKLCRDIIRPFMEEGLVERAAVLAEKFKEFELLIEMCIDSNDMDRLYGYIDKYPNEGVAELAFAQIVDRGGPLVSALLRATQPHIASRLVAWLQAAPSRAHLLALQRLAARDYGAAAPALAQLAGDEQDSVNRMTTMASLAKLCLLASDEPDNQPTDTRRKVETCLALGDQHAALPRDLRLHYGLDSEDTRVIAPEELVQMYIETESQSLTEYDYKKALDLTDYVTDMERRDDLRLKVWCACIRHDSWESCRMDAPAEELQAKMFFRLIDLVHLMGGDLELLLPAVEDILTAPALSSVVADARAQYIIKYGYECLHARPHTTPQA
ncbi:hypothetical protein ABMA28_007983 [Loxostege sticticalis]|uniref:Nucleoporin Nup133/Nup155-like N-terminal domain-containing protein n=1 Tax=Loxostege sticticalis TaxID=481309 RepID=A0ABD0SJT0_LOXSC